MPDGPDFPDEEAERDSPGFSDSLQDTQPVRLAGGFRGSAYREDVRHSHSRTGAGEPPTFVDPKDRNAAAASLTSLAHVDNLKPDIFTFSVTVGPDHQDLALPTLSFQSFLKFPVRKEQ